MRRMFLWPWSTDTKNRRHRRMLYHVEADHIEGEKMGEMQEESQSTISNPTDTKWIRGVNLGGWLLLERFITPYIFAISTCDLSGDFRVFPGQIDAPPGNTNYVKTNLEECTPVVPYPVDEYTLTAAFNNKPLARSYLERHWNSFLTEDDLKQIKSSGLDYVRVPIPHWIFGNISSEEPYVDGQWPHFVRMCNWARDIGLQVWPDIHTAPGSQNGFDNSGRLNSDGPTGLGWAGNSTNVERSLGVVQDLVSHVIKYRLSDVVTGIGILNEPFKDVPMDTARRFYDRALDIIRQSELSNDTAVFIGDLFNSTLWSGYWNDAENHNNTYLDSHYYHGKY